MTKKTKPKQKYIPRIKELAQELDTEFKKYLQLTLLKDGSVAYKNYVVKKSKLGNWSIFNQQNPYDVVGEFKLKTCAILAAKAYSATRMQTYLEIESLDNKYWASHCDMLVYKKIIKSNVPLDRFIILLNKLEDSELKEQVLKAKITAMFHTSFA